MTKTGRRDEIVLATKYSAGYKTTSGPTLLQSNFGGNSAKSLHVSVEASLKKLQTTYIDLVASHTFSHMPQTLLDEHHLPLPFSLSSTFISGTCTPASLK